MKNNLKENTLLIEKLGNGVERTRIELIKESYSLLDANKIIDKVIAGYCKKHKLNLIGVKRILK